jgi:hypothetical protein
LARDISNRIEHEVPGDAIAERDVREILQHHPEFVHNGRYRWQVGYKAQPQVARCGPA